MIVEETWEGGGVPLLVQTLGMNDETKHCRILLCTRLDAGGTGEQNLDVFVCYHGQ